jgi:hypothetical protein
MQLSDRVVFCLAHVRPGSIPSIVKRKKIVCLGAGGRVCRDTDYRSSADNINEEMNIAGQVVRQKRGLGNRRAAGRTTKHVRV